MLQLVKVRDLGLQAAQLISLAEDPLAALIEVSGNMPGKAAALSRLRVNKATRQELAHVQRYFPAGAAVHCNALCVQAGTML